MTRIIYDRNICVGAGACIAAFGEAFEMNTDGKADLKGGAKTNDGKYAITITDDRKEAADQAINTCPINAINKEETT